MRIAKIVKAFGATVVSTSPQTLETQSIKNLGDIISWSLRTDLTTVAGTGTYDTDGGTPSGSWKGSNVNKLYKQVSIKDNNNVDLFVGQGTDLHLMAYLISLIDPNEFLFERGLSQTPTVDTTTVTAVVSQLIIPQSILGKDLPASLEIQIGVLDDYYNVTGTGTATINSVTFVARYAPPQQSGFTVRCKAFNITSFAADTDIAYLLPNNINILVLAYLPSNPNAGSAPADMVNTRVDFLTLRRGSNEEIEQQRRDSIDYFIDKEYANVRPTGLTVLPLDAFVKTDSTFWKFQVNASITPRIYYVYR